MPHPDVPAIRLMARVKVHQTRPASRRLEALGRPVWLLPRARSLRAADRALHCLRSLVRPNDACECVRVLGGCHFRHRLVCARANQLFLQRAQRTVRPAAPSEAFSIAYDVEQFGQTICMGPTSFRVQRYQPSVNASETMATPGNMGGIANFRPVGRHNPVKKSAVLDECAGGGRFLYASRTTAGQ